MNMKTKNPQIAKAKSLAGLSAVSIDLQAQGFLRGGERVGTLIISGQGD